MILNAPSLTTGVGTTGGVGTMTVRAVPPAKPEKSSAELTAVAGLFANAPSFQIRQPMLMLVAVGVLQSSALVQPAMPGSHIYPWYIGFPLGLLAGTGPYSFSMVSICSGRRQCADLAPRQCRALSLLMTTGVVQR
jgi:hypothetical protein